MYSIDSHQNSLNQQMKLKRKKYCWSATDSQQVSTEIVRPAKEPHKDFVADHPVGLTDTLKAPADSQQVSAEAVKPAEMMHKMESDHSMHIK